METETLRQEELIPIIQENLGEKYGDIRSLTEGSTRWVYTAKWGPAEEKVVIKVDKPRIQAALHNITPEAHNLQPLRDFAQVNYKGHNAQITVEPYYSNTTLEDIVKKKPLTTQQLRTAFNGVIKGVRTLNQRAKIYHRDLKPSNILVKDTGEARLTDYANACSVDHPTAQYSPTAGGHFITAPWLFGAFNNKPEAYNEQAEIHALGSCMYFALTGTYPTDCDPDTGVAIDIASNTSLLNTENKIDKEKYETAITAALNRLPKKTKDLKSIIRKAITRKYKTLDQLAEEFEATVSGEATVFKFIRNFVIAGVLGLGALVGIQELTKKAPEEKQEEKYMVNDEVSNTDLSVTNNLFDVDISVYGKGYKKIDNEKGATFKPGERINVTIRPHEFPHAKRQDISYSSFPARIYVEGYEPKKFWAYIYGFNEGIYAEGSAGFNNSQDITLPSEVEWNNHVLAIEIYPPEEKKDDRSITAEDKITFVRPNQALYRKRIPISIGKDNTPKNSVRSWYLDGYTEHISIINPENTQYRGNVQISFPKKNHNLELITSSGYTRLSDPKKPGTYLAEITWFDKEKISGKTWLPLEYKQEFKDYEGKIHYRWYNAIPEQNFADSLVELREANQKTTPVRGLEAK